MSVEASSTGAPQMSKAASNAPSPWRLGDLATWRFSDPTDGTRQLLRRRTLGCPDQRVRPHPLHERLLDVGWLQRDVAACGFGRFIQRQLEIPVIGELSRDVVD